MLRQVPLISYQDEHTLLLARSRRPWDETSIRLVAAGAHGPARLGPSKLQLVRFLQQRASAAFLRLHQLQGEPAGPSCRHSGGRRMRIVKHGFGMRFTHEGRLTPKLERPNTRGRLEQVLGNLEESEQGGGFDGPPRSSRRHTLNATGQSRATLSLR